MIKGTKPRDVNEHAYFEGRIHRALSLNAGQKLDQLPAGELSSFVRGFDDHLLDFLAEERQKNREARRTALRAGTKPMRDLAKPVSDHLRRVADWRAPKKTRWRPDRADPEQLILPFVEFRRPKRALGRAFARLSVVSSTLVTVSAVALTGVHLAVPKASEAQLSAAIREVAPTGEQVETLSILDCARRLPAFSGKQTLIGFVTDPSCDPAFADAPIHRFAALSEEDVEDFADLYSLVEGGFQPQRGKLLGQDIFGMMRGFVSSVSKTLGFSDYAVGRTTAYQTAFEVVQGEVGSLSMRAKVPLIVQGAYFAATELYEEADRARFVAENMLCAKATNGEFGASISGGLCSPVLFGKSEPGSLLIEEKCTIVAAAKRQVPVLAPNASSEVRQAAATAFDGVRDRAFNLCLEPLRQAGELSEQEFAEAAARLQELKLPVGEPGGRPIDPEKWIFYNAPGLVTTLRDAMKLGAPSNQVSTTIDTDIQAHLASAIDEALDEVTPLLSAELCIEDCDAELQYLMVIAEHVGERLVVRGVVGSDPELLYGPIKNGERVQAHRGSASIGKALLLPLILDVVGDELFCRRAFDGLHDPGGHAGYDCSRPEHFVSLDTTIRFSLNTPFVEALRAVPSEDIKAYLDFVGFQRDPQLSDEQLVRATTLGNVVRLTPDAAMRGLSAIAFGRSSGPSLLADGTDALPALSLEDIVSEDTVAIAREKLTEPLGPNGTLEGLSVSGCDLFAKSGTSESTVNTEARDLILGTAAMCGGRKFVSLALLGSPRIDVPLGDVTHDVTSKLAASAIEAALNAAPFSPPTHMEVAQ